MVNTLPTAIVVNADVNERRWLSDAFAQFGLDVFACTEREAAEALLASQPVHVVVTSLQLSPHHGKDGLRLIRHTSQHYPDVKIIALGNQSWTQESQLVHEVGGNWRLDTPTDAKNAVQLVRGILETLHIDRSSSEGHIHDIAPLADFLSSKAVGIRFQPIVQLGQKKATILGIEALARPKDQFASWKTEFTFNYAALKEQIYETDLLCIDEALKLAQQLVKPYKLFLNVRPRSLINPQFASQLASRVQQAGFTPQQIVLELTEQQSIVNLPAFSSTLDAVRALGFKLALDDFGAGFANLQLVQDLKPDYLKLSGVFCRELEHDHAKQVIVQNVVQMAKTLGIDVILENVETQAELKVAQSFGIQFSQGFLFYKPMTVEQLNTI